MAATLLEQLGVWIQDFRDRAWHTKLNESLTSINSRLSKSYAGDPNGHVVGNWLGQHCWDTSANKPWFCITVGDEFTAEWASLDADPIGTMKTFLVAPPTGWLELDGGQYTEGDYPLLEAIFPDWVSGGFLTLPNAAGASVTQAADLGTVGSTSGSWTVTPQLQGPDEKVDNSLLKPAVFIPTISKAAWNVTPFNFNARWAVRAR